ncbi:putative inactive purple acid phosphatase 27, partial [Sesamum angolense]
MPSAAFRVLRSFLLVFIIIVNPANCLTLSSSSLPESLLRSTIHLRNHTAISEFRVVNRRHLINCPDHNPYLQLNISSDTLSDDEYVTVNITGVLLPSSNDWVAMISPSHSNVKTCIENAIKYEQTGDFSSLPLLCHYPVKAQYVSNDPDYLNCSKKECKKYKGGECVLTTCGATLSFHVINIRTDIEFVLFGAGFQTPCILKRSLPAAFANPNNPLYAHISSTDSTGTSMTLTWVSGDEKPQQVQYGNGQKATSSVSTFSQADMCTSSLLESPAIDFGWHDPGYIHSAVMTGLNPSATYSYKYGRYLKHNNASRNFASTYVLHRKKCNFCPIQTPPAGGSDELRFLAYGDMGKAPLDSSVEHYIQPGSISVTGAMADEVSSGSIDSIFHIGDISYATGFLVEWDFFLNLISPLASQVSYMTAIGNHERDYIDSGSVYITPDSGGECGVPYETYFPMPTAARDKPWYSIEQGSVHFTVISTEHNWSVNSEQYEWMNKDMAAVDRTRTPWLIFAGTIEVDLALFGHVHNYERTCAVYQQECKAMPSKDPNGVDTYDNANYSAPVHAVIGMAGFTLDSFSKHDNSWSLCRTSEFGYIRAHATKEELTVE